MITKNGKTIYLQAVTMIDSATGQIEIRTVPSACVDLVSKIVELAWLTRYPLPSKVIVDCKKEFLAKFKTMIQADYGITIKPITSRNPRANSISERIHQTMGKIIRMFKVQDMVLYDENPWDGILASTMVALCATIHTTTQYSQAQLVLGQNSILNTCHEANQQFNWQLINKRKQNLSNEGNQQECWNEKEHMCNKGDKILLKIAKKLKFNQDAYLGPYTITGVRNKGTVRAHEGEIRETFNILTILLCTRNKCSSIMRQYDIHECTQLQDQLKIMS